MASSPSCNCSFALSSSIPYTVPSGATSTFSASLMRIVSTSVVFSRSRKYAMLCLAARGESLASHRDGRGAPPARRDDREYREYLSEEQRSQRGCIARRMQPDFHHGLLGSYVSCMIHAPASPKYFTITVITSQPSPSPTA